MRVAESTVIFSPICQVGCASASFEVTATIWSFVCPLNGPPEAVNIILLRLSSSWPCKHCQTALGSLSRGRILPPCRLAVSRINPPAMTNGSLLAIPTVLPAHNASSVGNKPTAPTSPFTTMSVSFCAAISRSPFSPEITFVFSVRAPRTYASSLSSATETNFGRHLSACEINLSSCCPALSPIT